ncbi:hypothetical protein N7539_001964 [Penicillium diatomitis]|uniref:Rab-GAP TBC domain-containing protein n=1 Tax=Penicillium diatomitis TaxID=2819901 RepID=A0A9W9XHQ2_9EURO|nr:uncharacterized protein N7539_001964 [Penicillium diatomitis]KAJ5493218.1 hypothetical protein N7539_001964 [Penicillium diatomitis]
MTVEAASSLSPGSHLASATPALRNGETAVGQRPYTTRSVSLPTPSETPIEPNGRSFSTSAAPPDITDRPVTARSLRRINPNEGEPTTLSQTGRDDGKLLPGDNSECEAPSLRSVPSIVINESGRPSSRPGSRWSERRWGGLKKRSMELERKISTGELPPVPRIEPDFNGISLDIPNASLGEIEQGLKFSTRGSLIRDRSKRPYPAIAKSLHAQEALKENAPRHPSGVTALPAIDLVRDSEDAHATGNLDVKETSENSSQESTGLTAPIAIPRVRPQSSLRPRQSSLQSRAISADEDMLSRRVRLMYEKGDDNVTDSEVARAMASDNGILWEEPATVDIETASTPAPEIHHNDHKGRASEEVERLRMKRETRELAGGIEYWQDVGVGQVDRYGFIHTSSDEPHPLQRVTTSLLLASEAPRRKRSIRPPTARASTRSFSARPPTQDSYKEPTAGRPASSASTRSMPVRRSTSRLRSATNHLPHNWDRKAKDEAGDMLTLPGDAFDAGPDTPSARAMRRKEWQREDKWTKMAIPVKKSRDGGGMKFEFDTRSSKLIERTWKGIPDRWRSTAWYSFLETSAKRHPDSPTEDTLIEAFRDYQYVSSPDDVQIDIDVPRTITSHIMFRRRYRGGQRLLFRVLHAMSLYFPDTGYVQGMAALAATLLAYYDEEHAFVMLARLWELRGLGELYKSGFAGLMEALDDFEREWLAGGEVAIKLNEVGIPPTTYGTKWYLTLFNYSIPFAAQLRVWDVFMLLGDAEDLTAAPHTVASHGKEKETSSPARASTFGQGLDVLHATSAALIDGMREIILESDFENSMKVLTSWVPIKDIEIFMRVAKAEWKVHRRKKLT